MFGVAALLGVTVSAWFLPAAYLAHGLWDLAHPTLAIGARVDSAVVHPLVRRHRRDRGIGLIAIWIRTGVIQPA